MDGKYYRYRAQLTILQGGYAGEDVGVSPADDNWHDSTSLTGSQTYTYYYTDSNVDPGRNDISSQVRINATNSWEASFSNANVLTIRLHTVINSVTRGNIRGAQPARPGRDIVIRQTANGRDIFKTTDLPLNTEHTIATNLDLGTYNIVLPPGSNTTYPSFYVLNHTTGKAWTSVYIDEMTAGISFQNPMPPDYRPGMTWNGSAWMSHNRANGGVANIYKNGGWQTMRTENGGVGTGNPPLIYNGTQFVNQRKIGQE